MKSVTTRSSIVQKQWSNLKRNRLAVFGLFIIVVLGLATIFADLLTSYSPNGVDLSNRVQPPSTEHFLGTDKLGRDVFSRVLYGGRLSITIGLCGALGAAFLGVIFGSIGGYFGGWVDRILLRLSEVVMSFPALVLIMIFIAIFGQDVFNLIIVFAVTGWIGEYRLVRGRFLSLKNEYFVESCRAYGMSNLRIIFGQILPNAITPVIVSVTLATALYVIAEAGLGYLGLGVPPTTPTWGNILNSAQSIDVVREYWWLWLFPGSVISLFVLGVNTFGDGLRDLIDPNQ
ncbi:peptide/nickel transport system permease protein [Virgibacillus subterraneus]|uniref:Peptide/nickel transport system permease protein n=1 Tax=Virgibacillus subterraneus TaxID=621109 RepID=A0A1H9G5X0_9BACI|nr:ABC transporter permease [Virgibacillus subterraneus]SEQ45454.1 peptide/nickel transport system permease protein [Virgibacillus subterraneus]